MRIYKSVYGMRSNNTFEYICDAIYSLTNYIKQKKNYDNRWFLYIWLFYWNQQVSSCIRNIYLYFMSVMYPIIYIINLCISVYALCYKKRAYKYSTISIMETMYISYNNLTFSFLFLFSNSMQHCVYIIIIRHKHVYK